MSGFKLIIEKFTAYAMFSWRRWRLMSYLKAHSKVWDNFW